MNGYDIFKAMNGTDEKYIEMSESLRSRGRRPAKAVKIAIGAAAAAAVMTSVSVGAYNEGYRFEDGHFVKLNDSEIISTFGGEGAEEWLESNGLNEKQNAENGHFDITMYSFISDGNFCRAIWSIEALDEAARGQLNHFYGVAIEGYYADTGERVIGIGSWTDTSLNDETHTYLAAELPLKDVDVSRDIAFHILTGSVCVDGADDLTDGMKFVVNAAPNVETKTIASEKGDELLLSPLGVSQKYRKGEEYPYDGKYIVNNWALIKSDGSIETFRSGWGCGCWIDDEEYYGEFPVMWKLQWLYNIVDISDVDGVKINDDVYMDVNK